MHLCSTWLGVLERESQRFDRSRIGCWQWSHHVLLPVLVCRVGGTALNSSSRIALWSRSIAVKEGKSIRLVGMKKSELYSDIALVSGE